MNKTIIPIMTCFDKNYVIQGAVAFYSLLEHANKKYFYKIYVLHTDIDKKDQNKLKNTIKEFCSFSSLEFIDMKNRFEDIWEKIYRGGHFSKEVMYKLLVASIFPKYEKIVMTDVDVVFLDDISKSYIDFDENSNDYLGVIKPIGKIKNYAKAYEEKWTKEEMQKLNIFCGGYLIANLKQIRKDDMEKKFVKSFIENGYRLNQMEQDVLNICCFNHVKFLPLNYVACSYMWDFFNDENSMQTDETYTKEEIKDAMEKPIQLHYATSVKPWKHPACTKSEAWFQYLLKTNMVNEYIKSLPTLIKEMPQKLSDTKSNDINIINIIIQKTKKLLLKPFELKKKQKKEYEKVIKEKELEIKRLEEIIKFNKKEGDKR